MLSQALKEHMVIRDHKMLSDRRALTLLGPVAVALTAAALAGCGGGGGSSSQAQSVAPTTTISVGTTGVGDVLMDSQTNHTVYLFKKDTGPTSACSGACAHDWPPVRATGTPAAGGGAKAALIGIIKRSDGAPQVTYNGHPLYLYVGDNRPNSTNGQAVMAFGAPWFAVSPAGNAVTKRCAATGCSSGY
jgi:predicted lipoprotein with Yx(FWY)xxD motif